MRSMTPQFPKENAPTQAGRFRPRPDAHAPAGSSSGCGQGVRRISPATSETTNSTRKMKNSTFAISAAPAAIPVKPKTAATRSEEHTSELQSLRHLVCRLLLEKKK